MIDIYVVGKEGEAVGRYYWATPFCYQKDVLDIGCKDGLGMEIMSCVAKSVIGIDIKDRFKMKDSGLVFQLMDAQKELPIGEFGVVTCFEVLEHVGRPLDVLNNVWSVIHDDGLFICSVPSCDRSDVMSENTHVVQYYEKEDFTGMLTRLFHIELLFNYLGVSWMAIARKRGYL